MTAVHSGWVIGDCRRCFQVRSTGLHSSSEDDDPDFRDISFPTDTAMQNVRILLAILHGHNISFCISCNIYAAISAHFLTEFELIIVCPCAILANSFLLNAIFTLRISFSVVLSYQLRETA